MLLLSRLDPRAARLIRLAGLAAVVWTVVHATDHPALSGRGLVVTVSLALAGLGWLVWALRPDHRSPWLPEIVLLAAAGGVLCGASPSSAAPACVFIAVVVAGIRIELD